MKLRLEDAVALKGRLQSFSGEADSLVAVWKVKQVLHGHERVDESFGRGDPLLCVDQQHLLQQAHELSAVCLLSQQITTFQIHHQVYLQWKQLLKRLVQIVVFQKKMLF